MGMDWTQIIIAVLGALAGIDLGRFLFIKLTKRGMAAEVKEKEIDVIRFLPQLEMRPSSNAPSPVESREAPPTSSFPDFSEPP